MGSTAEWRGPREGREVKGRTVDTAQLEQQGGDGLGEHEEILKNMGSSQKQADVCVPSVLE